jgi:predicted DNA-binding protein
MAQDHPDAPKQYGIRLSQETMELVAEIQEHHRKSNKPHTLAAIVESAIENYYDTLVEDGEIEG